jgi:hypothetical protein
VDASEDRDVEPDEPPSGSGDATAEAESERAVPDGESRPAEGARGARTETSAPPAESEAGGDEAEAAQGTVEAKGAEPKPGDEEGDGGGDQDELEETAAERRSGFMVGISLAGALGGASGYPNDANKIDRDEYYTNTGVAFGGGGMVWIGGALTDWISVGLGVTYAALFPTDQLLTGGSVELHVEAFPAWALGGVWRELGVYVLTGAGLATLELAEGSDPLVDTGAASRIGAGVFYEGIRAWQISMGPFVGGDLLWSPSALRPVALLGWRTVLYTGP